MGTGRELEWVRQEIPDHAEQEVHCVPDRSGTGHIAHTPNQMHRACREDKTWTDGDISLARD